MKKIPYEKYITKLNRTEKGFDDRYYQLGSCGLCGGTFKLAGIRSHIYYKHFYEAGNEYDWCDNRFDTY